MQSGARTFLQSVADAIRLDRLPLLTCAIFIIVSLSLLATKGINGVDPVSIALNAQLMMTCVAFWIGSWFVCALFRARPDSPVQFAKTFLSANLNLAVIARHFPVLIALCFYMPIFSAMKSSISLFVEYNWDNVFIRWDQMIHFGDAWRLVHPLLGQPAITFFLNLCYNFWIVLIYAATVYFALQTRDPIIRQRFLFSYFACWTFLGVAGAIGLASVGPAFVGPLFGNSHFDQQLAYLVEANTHYQIISVEVQARLVEKFLDESRELGTGITAMPSMHVSMAFLFFLVGRHFSKAAAVLFGIFFLCILVGSVHLAYHYAVDGYVSIIATTLIWTISGVLYGRRSQWFAKIGSNPIYPVT
jgi:PAP2 superfamily